MGAAAVARRNFLTLCTSRREEKAPTSQQQQREISGVSKERERERVSPVCNQIPKLIIPPFPRLGALLLPFFYIYLHLLLSVDNTRTIHNRYEKIQT